ncbi:ceramide synthase 1-like [Ptychodera flava]|uniref:ceramide synthase 1-like n=1 Tax=Ptychodera flava TaxID=63121 RepID=UPI00396AA2C5
MANAETRLGDINGQETGLSFTPSYSLMLTEVYQGQKELISNLTPDFDYFGQCLHYCFWTWGDVWLILGFAVIWTILRYVLTWSIYQPFYRRLKLDEEDEAKAPESSFKSIWYMCSWTYCCYILFFKGNNIFQEPRLIFADWHVGMTVPYDIYIIYMYQLGFYIHSIYATLYMDHKRKDFLMMLVHHVLTILLLGISYLVRYHKIGLLVLFCHDLTDVCLECGKMFIYTKKRDGQSHQINEVLANVCFAGFTLTWILLRLYWFPLKALYAAGAYTIDSMPYVTTFNIMLWILQIMNIYWFSFIVTMLFRLLLGKADELSDIREETEEFLNQQKLKQKGSGDALSNGVENNAVYSKKDN